MSDIERRQDRQEDAIERLTNISVDLNKLIAVQEQRITQQEKETETIFRMFENRRNEFDGKIKENLKESQEKQNKVLEELNFFKKEYKENCNKMNNRINALEKYMWMAMGAFTIFTLLINFIKI